VMGQRDLDAHRGEGISVRANPRRRICVIRKKNTIKRILDEWGDYGFVQGGVQKIGESV